MAEPRVDPDYEMDEGPMLAAFLDWQREEYARHIGHLDLLRERIDGATGD